MASGIQRVLMVNQLVGKANMQFIAQLQQHYPTVDFICCIDSIENARALSAFLPVSKQTLNVMIETGCFPAGAVVAAQLMPHWHWLNRQPNYRGVTPRGLELYEGVLHGDDPQPQVEALLRDAAQLACDMANLVDGEFILNGAGTVWYDVVCNIWLAAEKPDNCPHLLFALAATSLTHTGIYGRGTTTVACPHDPVAFDMGRRLDSHLRWNWVAMVANRCRK